MGKIPNCTDSERFETPETACMLNFTMTKNSISLDSRSVDLKNTRKRAPLKHTRRRMAKSEVANSSREMESLYKKLKMEEEHRSDGGDS